MELVLLGNGKMNRLVAELAAGQGHRVAKVIGRGDRWTAGWAPDLVAIDFSVADAVLEHVDQSMAAGIPLVIGATGWLDQLEAVRALVDASHVGAVYGANFSVGVQAFYRAVAAAAAALPAGYDSFVWEAHHREKRDAPSGTARHLAGLMRDAGHDPGSIASTRAGWLPGTHTAGFDSPDDTLTITHTARSRRGFAAGALLAAQWILGKRGLHEFSEVIP
ncbi:MAG TPA: dihydrodipicolinate reductase C-terminal domain-containing protein [Terriglobales bacterium]|nr:dihydrodipicolinate reductase C-terminal domain-containing protein [Terriglobales bacterium]